MRRPQRLIAATILVALSSALAGCGSMGNFDPTDMLDFLDTKKKLPGERKPVFPDGVPGLEQGVPKDLYRGARQQQIDDPNAQAAVARAPPPQEPKSKGSRNPRASRRRPPCARRAARAAADPDAAPEEEGGTAAAPPAPQPKRIVRKRTTAPPPDPAGRARAASAATIRRTVPGADAERYVYALNFTSDIRLTRPSKRASGLFMSFTIAIIGRPNVGKSTLFNRLVGQKLALVDDEPGVTRDRREGNGRLGDLEFTVIDTAGLDEGAKGSLTARMQEQTETAIALADALMFVIDARAGLTPNDRAFADFARRANKPVVLVANKSEGRHGEVGAMESYALGLGDPIQISAEHGEGLSDLYDALRVLMPDPTEEGEEFDDDDIIESDEDFAKRPIRVAIVGRPNAGKSTLINHLLGEERLLTSAEAGTTRDSISVEVTWQGRDFRVFDTAGLRRRARIDEKLEKLSVADALRAVRFAEVVVMMMDAQNRFEEQDLRIADLIEREGRAIVLAVNKWDLMEKKGSLISALRTDVDHLLPQMRGAPVVAVSGLMGEGIDRLMTAIQEAYAVWNKRVPTAALNRWFEQAVDANPPPSVSGRRLKLNYITQAKARPPSFILFCSRADAVPTSYLRYLTNSMREAFDLPGTPIRIMLREKANPFAHKRKRPS